MLKHKRVFLPLCLVLVFASVSYTHLSCCWTNAFKKGNFYAKGKNDCAVLFTSLPGDTL